MRLRTLLVALIACAISHQLVMGQTVEVGMPDDRAGKEQKLPPPPVNPEDTNYAWVAYKGYQPLKLPKLGSAPSGAPPLAFMQPCLYLAQYEGTTEYLLLAEGAPGTPSFKYLGWVEKRHCVVKNSEAEKTANEIHRKAMIVNRPETIQVMPKLDPGKSYRDVPIFLGPSAEAEQGPPLQLFNILFVYGDSEPSNEEAGYLLLGRESRFKGSLSLRDHKFATQVVYGWVPKNRVCRWDTAEALEWNAANTVPGLPSRRVTPGRVYEKVEDALKAVSGGEPAPLFAEVMDAKGSLARTIPLDRMRFPVLPSKGHEVLSHDVGGKLYRVGWVGGYVDASGAAVASAEEVEVLRRKLIDLQTEITQTEILFVVDSTASMEKYMAATAEAIDRIITSVRGDPNRKVKIGLTLYSDLDFLSTPKITKKEQTVRNIPLVDATTEAAAKITADLRRQAREGGLGGGGDLREMVFYGLRQGIQNAGFSKNARKVVFLIGDYGDHDKDVDGKHTEERSIADELVKIDIDKAKRIVATETPIDFFAIHVKDPGAKDEDARAFKMQSEMIMQICTEQLAKAGISSEGRYKYLSIQDEDIIIKTLFGRYEFIQRDIANLNESLIKLHAGQFSDVTIGPAMRSLLLGKGIEIDTFVKAKGVQVFSVGYVWHNSLDKNQAGEALPQIRRKYLVNKSATQELINMLRPWIEESSTATDRENLLEKVISGAILEQTKNIQFSKLKQMSQGLTFQTPLLKKLLVGEVRVDANALSDLELIKVKRLRLDDAMNNLYTKYVPQEALTTNKQPYRTWKKDGGSIQQNRTFKLGSEEATLWIWADLDDEWP